MKKAFTAFLILISLTLMYGCESSYFYGPDSYYSDAEWNGGNSVLNGKPFYEDKTIYNNDKDGDVTCLYLTVREGKDLALKKSYSFGYLKSYTDSDITAGEEPFCNVLMSVGTTDKSTIPGNFGYLETVTNATLTIKGDTEKIKQRSFQLKLFDRAGLWNGMKTINLMKNTNDISRVKEKLCFDVIEKINNISGFRTGFVRLFTRDTTETDTNLLWVDNGIYTFIEQPNKAYLTSRGYDSSGYLYRSKDFNFKTNPALIDVGDPKYNATDFEKILSIRAGKNHTSLINTIKNVNSPDVDINTLMGLSFNEENMLTYMAINILFANCRAYNDDYLLYAPSDSMTWYFLCEGFRDVFNCYDPENKIPLHIMSYSFLQNNLLFSKYLKTPANRIKLSKKLDEIKNIITTDYINSQISIYKSSILRYIYSMPEILLLPDSAEKVEPYMKSFATMIESQYNAAKKALEGPLAPYITDITFNDDNTVIKYDGVSDGTVTYKLQFSTEEDFSTIFFTSPAVSSTSITLQGFKKQSCFVRVIATDNQGQIAYSSNIESSYMGQTVYGCAIFE